MGFIMEQAGGLAVTGKAVVVIFSCVCVLCVCALWALCCVVVKQQASGRPGRVAGACAAWQCRASTGWCREASLAHTPLAPPHNHPPLPQAHKYHFCTHTPCSHNLPPSPRHGAHPQPAAQVGAPARADLPRLAGRRQPPHAVRGVNVFGVWWGFWGCGVESNIDGWLRLYWFLCVRVGLMCVVLCSGVYVCMAFQTGCMCCNDRFLWMPILTITFPHPHITGPSSKREMSKPAIAGAAATAVLSRQVVTAATGGDGL